MTIDFDCKPKGFTTWPLAEQVGHCYFTYCLHLFNISGSLEKFWGCEIPRVRVARKVRC